MGSLRNRGLSVTRGLIHEEMKEEPATLQESKEDEDFATVVNMSTGNMRLPFNTTTISKQLWKNRTG